VCVGVCVCGCGCVCVCVCVCARARARLVTSAMRRPKLLRHNIYMLLIYFQPFRNVVGNHYTIWLITKVVFHCLSLPLLISSRERGI